jgi:hypothetical protein
MRRHGMGRELLSRSRGEVVVEADSTKEEKHQPQPQSPVKVSGTWDAGSLGMATVNIDLTPAGVNASSKTLWSAICLQRCGWGDSKDGPATYLCTHTLTTRQTKCR